MRKYWFCLISLFSLLIAMESCSTANRSGRDFTRNKSSKSSKSSSSQRSKTYTSTKKHSNKVATRRTTKKKQPSDKSIASTNRKRNVKAEIVERNRIVDFARKYKGTPYRYGGKTPESGFDCSGLVYYSFRQFNYAMVAGSSNQAKLGKRIAAKNAIPGDLLFFGDARRVSHVGIVSYNDGQSLKMVHSSSSRGVIEEDIHASTYWKSRFLYARSVIGWMESSGRASSQP